MWNSWAIKNHTLEKIPKYILEYRKLSKLKSTYIDALPKVIDEDNRIHTSFNQTGTATGRLSSSDQQQLLCQGTFWI